MARVSVSLPDELKREALKEGFNFSQILREGLEEKLQIQRTNAWLRKVASQEGVKLSEGRVPETIRQGREERTKQIVENVQPGG